MSCAPNALGKATYRVVAACLLATCGLLILLTGVAAEEDDDGVAGTKTFTHSASSEDPNYDGNAVTIAGGTATEVDNDTIGVKVVPDADLPVPEGGSAEYTMVLTTKPTKDVTITVQPWRNSDDENLSASPTTLIFKVDEWEHAAAGNGLGDRGRRRREGHRPN